MIESADGGDCCSRTRHKCEKCAVSVSLMTMMNKMMKLMMILMILMKKRKKRMMTMWRCTRIHVVVVGVVDGVVVPNHYRHHQNCDFSRDSSRTIIEWRITWCYHYHHEQQQHRVLL